MRIKGGQKQAVTAHTTIEAHGFRKFVEALNTFIPEKVLGDVNGPGGFESVALSSSGASVAREYDDVKAELLVAQTDLTRALKICEQILEASMKMAQPGPRFKLALEELSATHEAGEELKDDVGFAIKFKKFRVSKEAMTVKTAEDLNKKRIALQKH